MKNAAVLTEDGTFARFFRTHPGEFDSSKVPNIREFGIQGQKKGLIPGGSAGMRAQLELTGA